MNRADYVAACAIGIGCSWNITNVGPAADQVAAHYGIGVAAVGFFTTAVFGGDFIAMATIDRALGALGTKRLGLASVLVCALGNLLTLLGGGVALALGLRLLVGIAVGWGFVCGSAFVHRAGGGPLHQGTYGGVSLAAGGSAVAIVPALTSSLGWEAPFVFAAVAGLLTLPLVLVGEKTEASVPGHRERAVHTLLGDTRLIRFALVHAASFGLGIILSTWVVNVLSGAGGYSESEAGLIGATILVLGVFSRPGGGLFVHLRPRRARALVFAVLAAGAFGSVLLGLAPPLPLALLATVLVGFASGAPFGTVAAGISRIFPDSPGAAFGAMNSYALILITVGTPLVGLTLSLPGDGLIGFAACGAFCLLVAFFVPPQRLLEPPAGDG